MRLPALPAQRLPSPLLTLLIGQRLVHMAGQHPVIVEVVVVLALDLRVMVGVGWGLRAAHACLRVPAKLQ